MTAVVVAMFDALASPMTKSPKAVVSAVAAPKFTVASVLVEVRVSGELEFGNDAQLGLKKRLIMKAVVFAPGSRSPAGNPPLTLYPAWPPVSPKLPGPVTVTVQ